jgi:hypothetical protein
MYGMINKAVKDLVVSKFSEQAWRSICQRAKIENDEFNSLETYPDSITYDLVAAASEELNIPGDQLLRAFGDYWITYTAEEGYGEMMDMFGKDLVSCLRNLNRMHSHMGSMMPDLQPPRFVVEEKENNTIVLRYFSRRQGLTPMIKGLLEGLARKYNTNIEIEHQVRPADCDHEVFHIKAR